VFAATLPFIGAIGAPELIVILVVVLVLAIPYWLFWVILGKAGFKQWPALLVFTGGIGQFILLCVLAFGDWPALRVQPAVPADVLPVPVEQGHRADGGR
jgi:hypothetical protein